jgi:hypothetical protein
MQTHKFCSSWNGLDPTPSIIWIDVNRNEASITIIMIGALPQNIMAQILLVPF